MEQKGAMLEINIFCGSGTCVPRSVQLQERGSSRRRPRIHARIKWRVRRRPRIHARIKWASDEVVDVIQNFFLLREAQHSTRDKMKSVDPRSRM